MSALKPFGVVQTYASIMAVGLLGTRSIRERGGRHSASAVSRSCYRSGMPIFKIARYEIRPEARAQVERAIHEFAAYVRAELPDSTWTTYRETHDRNRYISIITAASAAADERHRGALR